MHRHGTTRTCFKSHSKNPCLLERRMSVAPQTEHCRRRRSRACPLGIGVPVAASSGCLCADILDELPHSQRTAFRATNKCLALDEGHLKRTAFGVIKSFKICGSSSFHAQVPLFHVVAHPCGSFKECPATLHFGCHPQAFFTLSNRALPSDTCESPDIVSPHRVRIAGKFLDPSQQKHRLLLVALDLKAAID